MPVFGKNLDGRLSTGAECVVRQTAVGRVGLPEPYQNSRKPRFSIECFETEIVRLCLRKQGHALVVHLAVGQV